MCITSTVQWHFIPDIVESERVHFLPGDGPRMTHGMFEQRSADIIMHRASEGWYLKHTSCSNMREISMDMMMMMRMMMVTVPSREKGLTLGAQSVCAVLGGLAVPLAHLASVSRRRRVASPTPLPLTLAAAHGPFAPLVPASVNCITGYVDKDMEEYVSCRPLTHSNLLFISGNDISTSQS